MRGNWEKVNRAVRGALEGVSLAEMMSLPDFLAPAGARGAALNRAAN